MTAIVIVGAQWGDEGKGKIVDLCAENADMVVSVRLALREVPPRLRLPALWRRPVPWIP